MMPMCVRCGHQCDEHHDASSPVGRACAQRGCMCVAYDDGAIRPATPAPDPVALVREARALAKRATPGPWSVEDATRGRDVAWYIGDEGGDGPSVYVCAPAGAEGADVTDDAELIARARTLVVELADALEVERDELAGECAQSEGRLARAEIAEVDRQAAERERDEALARAERLREALVQIRDSREVYAMSLSVMARAALADDEAPGVSSR